jgi:Ca2+-binding EF-hand superfamily protein
MEKTEKNKSEYPSIQFINSEQRARIVAEFENMDKNNDGYITFNEIYSVMKNKFSDSIDIDDKMIKGMIKLMVPIFFINFFLYKDQFNSFQLKDLNGDGKIKFEGL